AGHIVDRLVRVHPLHDPPSDPVPQRVGYCERSLVHLAKADVSEVYVPPAVVDFLETHVLSLQCLRKWHPVGSPAEASRSADESLFEVVGVLDPRSPLWILAIRVLVDGRWRLLVEGLVRPLMVELFPKAVEPQLLATQ